MESREFYLSHLTKVQQEIQSAALRSGRDPKDITLLPVTKTQPIEVLECAWDLGVRIAGENHVQEIVEKKAHFQDRIQFHMIGHLQTNKVKYIAGKVDLIPSLDRQDLAKEIEKQAAKRQITQKCLVEINMGAEITKGGVRPEETLDFIQSMKDYPHIEVKGVMSVLPNLDDEVELAKLYDKLQRIYEDAKSIKQDGVNVEILSAGMSKDYKIALEHGSNMLRLGRVLFGERRVALATASQ